MLGLLVERDARRPFCAPQAWLVRALDADRLKREFFERTPHALALVAQMPWVLSFDERVHLFRELVERERRGVLGEHLPEHVRGHHVKIRREHMLEDGYVQLGGLPPGALKGTIRIEFISELGMAEAGIDRHGVFKEFLEETAAKAFDQNLGLFNSTPTRQLYPARASALAVGANHLQLFDFVGKMLGKAVYEGIVLDVSLADFVASKLLGKVNSLDELPSLDAELHSSLSFLKKYEGNVELDLCLTFSVDHDDLGVRETVELREVGSTIPVTKENRIEYVHLMADYALNKQLAPQSKAFVRGFHSVVPAGWLRLFSTPELQRLINGDDSPVDIEDLRKHTRYAGGYNDFSPTVRDLWSVLGTFSREDRARFLKFATSCSKAPLLGFAHLQPTFTVQCVSSDGAEVPSALAFFGMGRTETSRLPTASTCFNLLKLPNFKNKKVLREKLLYAIRSSSGFELS
uniref:HECT-type E3 ubiquitin transferase n=1 Tax=Calcidiscus leptoporus TaxID=127549 RepID=A0A7S0J4Y7_9EUKA